ncbi:MAG TPA: bifunctional phosphoglucose/phosphomannose isomerase [Candidatus Saccharimonadales bacterium]|nr:bifunctional phosphoglucose/phosphomannose isomerase [Candidatus Saccharimonadales bacterium]
MADVDSTVIESVEAIRAADPGNMLDRVKELPQQVRDAWKIAQAATLPPHFGDVRNITVLGMGGSAIGGEFAGALLLDELKVPLAVHRDYGLPAYVGRDSLVIASSFSGNTEETLSGLEEARKRGARIIGITTGGRVAELAKTYGFPLITFDYKAQPRAALGYSLAMVLGVLSKLGFVKDAGAEIDQALADLAKLEERVHEGAKTNDAKKLAIQLYGKVPVAFGAGVMGVMARRVKDQWNENAKNWAAYDVMSELNHNAVVGFPHPPAAREALVVLLLRSARDNARHQVRFEVTRELLDQANIPHHTLEFPGSSMLSEVLQMVLFTDYVSFYVALLNGADPSPVKSIDYLKDRLAKA